MKENDWFKTLNSKSMKVSRTTKYLELTIDGMFKWLPLIENLRTNIAGLYKSLVPVGQA